MVPVVQRCVGHEMIDSVITHAPKRVTSFVWPDGKANIVQNVSVPDVFFLYKPN